MEAQSTAHGAVAETSGSPFSSRAETPRPRGRVVTEGGEEAQRRSKAPRATSKRCTKCGEEKPLETGFHRQCRSPDGFSTVCKACSAVKARGYYLKSKGRTADPAASAAVAPADHQETETGASAPAPYLAAEETLEDPILIGPHALILDFEEYQDLLALLRLSLIHI